jgi:Flp pilus assembly protein TadD
MWRFFHRERQERPDYYAEALELARAERYHEAITSLRLALRERPGDPVILQQMAVVYTRIGMTDEAIRWYRKALERAPDAQGAHYGLAFLLLRRGEAEEARRHLRLFLARPPMDPDAARHVSHAREILLELDAPG